MPTRRTHPQRPAQCDPQTHNRKKKTIERERTFFYSTVRNTRARQTHISGNTFPNTIQTAVTQNYKAQRRSTDLFRWKGGPSYCAVHKRKTPNARGLARVEGGRVDRALPASTDSERTLQGGRVEGGLAPLLNVKLRIRIPKNFWNVTTSDGNHCRSVQCRMLHKCNQ